MLKIPSIAPKNKEKVQKNKKRELKSEKGLEQQKRVAKKEKLLFT